MNWNFLKWFQRQRGDAENPGAIITVDAAVARHDLIFGAPDLAVLPTSVSYLNQMPALRHLQDGAPFCVSYATTHMREYEAKKEGVYKTLSPDYVAFASRTGSTGNSVQNVLDVTRQQGIPLNEDYSYNPTQFDPQLAPYPVPDLSNEAKVRALGYRWKDYAFLRPYLPHELKMALQKGPIGITFGIEGSTFGYRTEGSVVSKPTKEYQSYHCVVCVGYSDLYGWQVFDSLRVSWYYLAPDYELTSAFVSTILPSDWKEMQTVSQAAQLPNNANRYGKIRDFNAETRFASLFLLHLQSLKNKSVLDAAGRDWTMLVRAGVYGNYNLTDLTNALYALRRTSQYPFNFDLVRK